MEPSFPLVPVLLLLLLLLLLESEDGVELSVLLVPVLLVMEIMVLSTMDKPRDEFCDCGACCGFFGDVTCLQSTCTLHIVYLHELTQLSLTSTDNVIAIHRTLYISIS